MIKEFAFKDDLIQTTTEPLNDGADVTIGDNKYSIKSIAPGKFIAELNGSATKVCCVVRDDKAFLDIEGILIELSIPTEDNEAAGGAGGLMGEKDKIFAPMPGKVVKILVEEGQEVKEKQPMVIVEAMKMENQVNAIAAGKVKKINFGDGDQVDTETPIIELEISEDK